MQSLTHIIFPIFPLISTDCTETTIIIITNTGTIRFDEIKSNWDQFCYTIICLVAYISGFNLVPQFTRGVEIFNNFVNSHPIALQPPSLSLPIAILLDLNKLHTNRTNFSYSFICLAAYISEIDLVPQFTRQLIPQYFS